jgi:hypothetical protein
MSKGKIEGLLSAAKTKTRRRRSLGCGVPLSVTEIPQRSDLLTESAARSIQNDPSRTLMSQSFLP